MSLRQTSFKLLACTSAVLIGVAVTPLLAHATAASTTPDLTSPVTASQAPVVAPPATNANPPTPLPTSPMPQAAGKPAAVAATPVAAVTPALTIVPPATPSQVAEVQGALAPAMPPALTPEPGLAIAGNLAGQAAPGSANGVANSLVKPGPGLAGPSGPDTYYDALGPAPTGPMSAVGPRKLNPSQEPASKFVIVEQDEGPHGREAQLTAADRALKLGDNEAAADMFDSLYAKYPHDPRVLMGRAVAYQNSNRPETAVKMYDDVLDKDPRDVEAQVNMLGMMSEHYPEVALHRLTELHDKYPGDPIIEAQIGVTEGHVGQFEDAERYLQMAVAQDPNNAQHQFNLAVIYDKAGSKPDATKYYQQALETDAVYGGSRSVPREQIYDRLAQLRQQ